MRATIFFLFYILLFTLAGCSSKYGIYKSYAFSRKMTAGNIPVDQHNNPLTSGVQKAHLVYIETSEDIDKPIWDTAWINGAAYSIEPLKLPHDKISLGKTMEETEEITIEAAPENIMWQLMLKPTRVSTTSESKSENIKKPITLSGVWKNKRVTYPIKKQTELATIYGQ